MDCSVTGNGSGPYVFKIKGELYHHQGALLPEDSGTPCYAQLYTYDPSKDLRFWQRNNEGALGSETLHDLQEMMQAYSPYVHIYQQAMKRLWNQPGGADVQARLTYKAHTYRQRYNIPTSNEIAIILPGENITADYRDIILQLILKIM